MDVAMMISNAVSIPIRTASNRLVVSIKAITAVAAVARNEASNGCCSIQSTQQQTEFWNRVSMSHLLSPRGETELETTSNKTIPLFSSIVNASLWAAHFVEAKWRGLWSEALPSTYTSSVRRQYHTGAQLYFPVTLLLCFREQLLELFHINVEFIISTTCCVEYRKHDPEWRQDY